MPPKLQIQPRVVPIPRVPDSRRLRSSHGSRVDDAGGLPYDTAHDGRRRYTFFGISGRARVEQAMLVHRVKGFDRSVSRSMGQKGRPPVSKYSVVIMARLQ